MDAVVVDADTKHNIADANFVTGNPLGEHNSEIHPGTHHTDDYGTFVGHINPGTLFAVYGVISLFNSLKRYQVAKREAALNRNDTKKLNFKCLLFSVRSEGCFAGAPVDALVICVMTVLGFFGELLAGFRDGVFVVITNTHHMCMFLFFHLVTVVKLLMHYRNSLPPKSDFAMFIVATLVEAFLFSGHVAGRTPMNSQIHVVLVYTILLTAVFTGLEILFPSSVLASLGRSISIIVHGLWFWAAGFILYPPFSFLPTWDQEDHSQMALVSSLFVTIIVTVIIGALIINRIIISKVNRLSLPAINCMQSSYYGQHFKPVTVGDPEKPLISDSDCEF